MPASEREASRDREVVRHQHSFPHDGRQSVPMWDSSDPDRAPPPLPFPPGAASPTTKANTSAGIAAAARQIVEKARESAPLSSYTSNREGTPQTSPDRSLVRGSHHRRLQTLATSNVRDLRNYLDSKSPERSPERPSSSASFARQKSNESIVTSPPPFDREPSSTSTPSRERTDPLKDTPTLRPAARPPPRPLMGENTPPSATMLALREMVVPDQPLNDITNGPGTPTPSRQSTSVDFSSQLLNLTAIATNLQREMAQLSRRSKDNATDLYSLKECANKRDEDIRKSLRELASGIGGPALLGPPPAPGSMSRSASSFANILDSKPWTSPPSASKSFPRAASAHSFLDDARVGSPSPYSVEGAASVAMLEKIIREMVTKEGQERLQTSLSELLEKNSAENSDAAKKVEELSQFIKETSQNQALVHMSKDGPPRLDLNFDSPGMLSKTRDAQGKEAQMISSDDEIVKILEHIKKSIGHTGGTTAEVKNIVRDLRGEVLGMGRDLGRKLEQVSEASLNTELDRSIQDGQGKLDTDEIQRIIEQGMVDLKAHISGVMIQRAEQDDESFKQLATRSGPDSEEIFAVVKHALSEHGAKLVKRDERSEDNDLDRDTVLDAVKEGLKDFEPNIELQQFGLERDEILTVLKEGLEEYQNNRPEAAGPPSVDKAAIYETMQEALKDFQAPLPHDQISQMKEDILANVQQALAEYQPTPSVAEVAIDSAAITAAVQEAMATHGPNAPRELDISREDLFDAVKASLDGTSVPFGGLGEQVLSHLRELFDNMKVEFQQYTAANGRDTEQVLDAVKDGLESLRGEIERYVDRAQDVTGKDEIEDCVRSGLEQLRADVQGYVAQGPTDPAAKSEVLDYIRSEFEHLHATMGSREASRDLGEAGESKAANSVEILEALKEHMADLKSHVSTSRGIDAESTGEGPSEEMLEAMKEEFDLLKTSILNANAHDKSELLETIQDSMGALHAKVNGSDLSALSGGATEDIIAELRAEFAALKESLHDVTSGEGERDAILTGVRHAIDDLRTQLSADQSDASAEALGSIKEELERFQTTMSSAVVLSAAEGGASAAKGLDDEILAELRTTLDELKETVASKSSGAEVSDELLEALRAEFENLRASIAGTVVNTGSNEEVLDAVRIGLDDLRSHVDKKLDNPDAATGHHGELLDAINDGLDTLRGDIVKTLDKPLDMTVNYEILDTLKDGLAGLRADMDKLKGGSGAADTVEAKGGEIVLADGADGDATRDMSGAAAAATADTSATNSAGFEKMEVILTQLQIKIEALSQDLPGLQAAAPAEGTAMKDDLIAVEGMLQDIQANVTILANKEESAPEGAARKEDTDAIETILRNTKAQLEEVAEVTISGGANKEQLDGVEAVVRMMQETVDAMSERLENTAAAKADVAVVEVLAQELKTAVDELKERVPIPNPDEEKPELMTKTDLDVLGIMCTEIKERVNEMILPDPEELPVKADIEQLHGLITDFRESHDKLRESYESDIGITAKAFDDRRKEFEDTVAQITGVKENLSEIKDEILAKMGDGDTSFETIGEMLKSIEEKTGDLAGGAALAELVEKLTQEFERAHGSLEAMKLDQQTAAETSLEKHAETREALTADIGEKLETYFDSLMSKYDDAQHAAEEKAKGLEEKVAAQEELLSSTKAMAEELRLSIDTLGSTLTSFPETMEKMTEESKTVFNRVEATYNKLDETQEGLKYEHTVTRDEVAKVLTAIGAVQADTSEHNPRFMVALKEVQALIGQHYEHSQRASDAAAEHAQAVKELQEQVRDLGTQNEELKTNVSALPALTAAPAVEAVPSPVEKYDDAAVHEKLDKLMGHAEDATNASTQLERLDQIHEKVMATAAEVSVFVAAQTKQIAEDHSNKEKEAEELALLLERRQVQKDEIEDDITVLNEEKDSLRTAVEALKAEKEALAAQKSRLNADVSALETAMHIRRDELHEMDRKAEAIERRMLEGVMNQSRMLLLAKGSKGSSPRKQKPQGRDLRVPSNASAVSAQTVTSAVPSLKNSHALAMKSRPPMQRNGAGPQPNTAERRIMSLNQIANNAAGRAPTPASLLASGPQSLKRSHSVKTQSSFRKPSWAGRREYSFASSHGDKENDTVPEEAEEDELAGTEEFEDAASDAQTERRTSYLSGTQTMHTDALTPGLESEDGTRMSYGTSDLSYMTGTGSYMTGSEVDRRTSLGSSADGVVGGDDAPSSIDEAEEEGAGAAPLQIEASAVGEEEDELAALADIVRDKKDVFYDPHDVDSGLGTDVPTAALSSVGGEGSYFRGEM